MSTDRGTDPRRVGYLWALVVGLLIGLGWVLASTVPPPLQQTCDPALSAGACSETIVAALKKGMPRFHPLLLVAHAEPGPESRNDQLGHRATVTFDAVGVPRPITVKLYLDMGAHWGGVADPRDGEVALWLIAQGAAVGAVVAGLGALAVRRRHVRA
jgi:hypothetical protein